MHPPERRTLLRKRPLVTIVRWILIINSKNELDPFEATDARLEIRQFWSKQIHRNILFIQKLHELLRMIYRIWLMEW